MTFIRFITGPRFDSELGVRYSELVFLGLDILSISTIMYLAIYRIKCRSFSFESVAQSRPVKAINNC